MQKKNVKFLICGLFLRFWYNYTSAQFKALKTHENAAQSVRKKIMQTAHARYVVYIVVVIAFALKRVDLFQVLRQKRLLDEYDPVSDGFVLRQYTVEFVALAIPALAC